MDKSAEPTAAPEAVAAPKAPAASVPPPEKTSAWQNLLKVAAYPVSVVSGFWMLNRDVHNSAYLNLKRYHAFDDILFKGKDGGLDARNRQNVNSRINNPEHHPVEKFLATSAQTKTEYGKLSTARMEHMGLGGGIENFPRKWGYINKASRTEAILKGATVTGIMAAVMLTVADSKALLNLLGAESKDKDISR